MSPMKSLNNDIYLQNICVDCGSSLLFMLNSSRANYIKNAVIANPQCFMFVSSNLKSDYNFTLACLQKSAQVANYVDKSLCKNLEWVRKALYINPQCFLDIVKRNNNVKSDKCCCFLASNYKENIKFVDTKFYKDFVFLKNIVRKNPRSIDIVLQVAQLSYGEKVTLSLSAVEEDAKAISALPNEFLADKTFVQRAIAQNVEVINYLPKFP